MKKNAKYLRGNPNHLKNTNDTIKKLVVNEQNKTLKFSHRILLGEILSRKRTIKTQMVIYSFRI